ncbi:MAG: hypothetical protein RIS29_1694 [Bacteroidota bacterium]|jgi:organic radical activating enzyme
MKNSLTVVEIFNSVQGEGANVGRSATFIRLAFCNKNCAYCDTFWQTGTEMTLAEIRSEIEKYNTKFLIWTGGEPTMQLDDEVLAYFDGYTHAIETNGTNPVPSRIDYISCSPKVGSQLLKKNFTHVNEFRFPVIKGDELPNIDELPQADNYFLSPVFDGETQHCMDINFENLNYCMELIQKDPRWRLSVQLHKLIHVR